MRSRVIISILFSLFCITRVPAQNETKVSPNDFEQQIKSQDVQILDVRTTGEFNSGHISRALWADWNNKSQFYYRLESVDKNKPVYVYCLSGGRSAAAAEWMRKNGYTKVVELKGGINAWKQENKPLEGMKVEKQITQADYNNQLDTKGYTLVDFGAEWCAPCKKMEPILDQLKTEQGNKLKFVRIDAGAQIDIQKLVQVEALPTFILYKNGKEVWRKEGITEIVEFKKQLGSK